MIADINNYLHLAEKIFVVLGTIIYLIFSGIIVKQTSTMSKNVDDKFNAVLIIFSYVHFLFSLLLVLLALVIL